MFFTGSVQSSVVGEPSSSEPAPAEAQSAQHLGLSAICKQCQKLLNDIPPPIQSIQIHRPTGFKLLETCDLCHIVRLQLPPGNPDEDDVVEQVIVTRLNVTDKRPSFMPLYIFIREMHPIKVMVVPQGILASKSKA
jgi:hypothetical protein